MRRACKSTKSGSIYRISACGRRQSPASRRQTKSQHTSAKISEWHRIITIMANGAPTSFGTFTINRFTVTKYVIGCITAQKVSLRFFNSLPSLIQNVVVWFKSILFGIHSDNVSTYGILTFKYFIWFHATFLLLTCYLC